jgi:hypothetical protein
VLVAADAASSRSSQKKALCDPASVGSRAHSRSRGVICGPAVTRSRGREHLTVRAQFILSMETLVRVGERWRRCFVVPPAGLACSSAEVTMDSRSSAGRADLTGRLRSTASAGQLRGEPGPIAQGREAPHTFGYGRLSSTLRATERVAPALTRKYGISGAAARLAKIRSHTDRCRSRTTSG